MKRRTKEAKLIKKKRINEDTMAPIKKQTKKTNKTITNATTKKTTKKTTKTTDQRRQKTTTETKANDRKPTKAKTPQPTNGLFLGTVKNKPFYYPTENLKKHFIALGASGSGKTVLSKVLLEEAALAGIPSIVVDVQGDLSALALTGDEENIAEHNLDVETLKRFKENVDVTIFTPISSKGIPLCINPLQLDESEMGEEEIIPILHSIASSFSKLLGYNLSNDKGKFAEAIMYSVLKYSFEQKKPIKNFTTLSKLITQPPKKLAETIEGFISDEKELATLTRKIKFLNVGEKKLLFQFGVPLDISLLLGQKTKRKEKINREEKRKNNKQKTKMSIIYMNTLPDQDEKEFFLAALTTKLYQWMLDHPSKKLQALYMIDEIAPFIPAGAKKPMPKDILKLLFKQARKYGISCVIATQNPGDIDYKAFAQFGSWAMGRLTLKQDIKKVDQALSSIAGSKGVESTLPKLQPGQFVLFSPDISKELLELKARWLYTKHQTLDEDEVKELMEEQQKEFKKYFVKTTDTNEQQAEDLNDEEEIEEYDIDEIIEEKNEESKESGEEQKTRAPNPALRTPSSEQSFCLGPEMSDEEIKAFAQKKKKKSLFGGEEQVVSIKKEYYPYIEAHIRTMRKKLFRKIEEEHKIFFDGITGEILIVKEKKHRRKINSRKLLECSENQLILAKTIMNEKKALSITELATKTGLDDRTVSKNLKVLENLGIVTFHREGKYKYYKTLVSFKEKIDKLDSFDINITSCPKKETCIRKEEVKAEAIQRFVRTWFKDSQVIGLRRILVPFHDITYHKKGKSRTITANGVTRETSEE